MNAPFRASDFLDSLGVNLSFNLIGAGRAQGVTDAVTWLGVRNVRSVLTDEMLQAGSAADRLAQAGLRFDVLLGSFRPLEETMANATQFAADHAGAVTALEGPNEINNWPMTYNGLTGVEAATAFLNAAAAQAAATPALANADIYDLTGAPMVSELINDVATYANIHPYPPAGNQPYAVLGARIDLRLVPGKGMVMTEAGYSSLPGATAAEGVDQLTQAKLLLNLVADATLLGVSKTYLFQLYDGQDANTFADTLGLFNYDLTPKLAGTALHNLTALLADAPGAPGNYATHALDYQLSGLPASGHSLLLEKASGTFDLLVWAEPDIWDEVADQAIVVAATTTTVRFGSGPVDVKVYDPLLSDQPIATYLQVTTLDLAITDHPLVVEISGFVGPLPEVAPMQYDLPQELTGTTAANTLTGGTADDVLWGLAGHDVLNGAGGDDTLDGGAGIDTLNGGTGNDRLIGGAGADKLWGGTGADTFVYTALGQSRLLATARDTIFDFDAASGDRIDLSAIDGNTLRAGNQAFVLGTDHFTGVRGQVIQVVTDKGLLIEADIQGDRVADFAVLLSGVDHALAGGAFIL